MVMDKSAASKSIFPMVKMVGAETEETFNGKLAVVKRVNTAVAIVSMP
jgi:hypothetical protein